MEDDIYDVECNAGDLVEPINDMLELLRAQREDVRTQAEYLAQCVKREDVRTQAEYLAQCVKWVGEQVRAQTAELQTQTALLHQLVQLLAPKSASSGGVSPHTTRQR